MATLKWRRRSSSFGSYGSYSRQRSEEPYKEDTAIEGYAYLCFPKDGSWFRGSLVGSDSTSYDLFGKCLQVTVVQEESPVIEKPPSKQRSMDSQMERELQFALDDIILPRCEGPSSPEILIGTPPMPQQLLSALDKLNLQDSGNFSSEEKEDSSLNSAASTPNFRSRSGSKSCKEAFVAKYDIKVTDLEEGSEHNILNVVCRHGNSCTFRSRQFCFIAEKSYWGQKADLVIQNNMATAELVGQGCHVFAGPAKLSYTQVFPSPSPSEKTYW